MVAETVASRLAIWAGSLQWADVPDEVRAQAKLHVLDTVGVALAASTFDFAAEIAGAVLDSPGGPATVIGAPGGWSCRGAAIVNGALAHGLDYDDTFMPGTLHPSASVLPTALAAAERSGCSARELLVAYVAGVEAATALGVLVPKGAMVAHGFHPTGVVGCFGSVVAAGRARGIGAGVLVDALGVAGSLASGLLQVIQAGGTSKRLHAGWAAGNALTAVELAVRGVTGPRNVFEGELGFRAFQGSGAVDWDQLSLPPDGAWRLPVVSFKLVPACHYNHALVRCAVALRHRVGDVRDVERVTIGLHPSQFAEVVEPVEEKRRPRTVYEAQFSAAFTVASGLVRGRFSLAELTDEALHDPVVRELAARCDAEPDPGGRFPESFSGKLRLRLRDGTVLEQTDDGSSPAEPEAAVERKFRENAGLALDDEAVEELLALVRDLDGLPSLAPLTGLLRRAVRASGQRGSAERQGRTAPPPP